jgi:glucose-1-phosphate thymidylyltransferase
MKGVILAGGTGSRLYPSTISTNKHLLSVYDKPLVYYPLSTLLMAGCRDIAIVSNESDLVFFEKLIGDGSRFGAKVNYYPQASANGIVGALQSAKNLSNDSNAMVILGDNIFFGGGIGSSFKSLNESSKASIWVKRVHNPSEYGVLTLGLKGNPIDIVEKPKDPKSNLAITGLYYFPSGFVNNLTSIKPSNRNELEITDLIQTFMNDKRLNVQHLSRGTAWFDAGTPERLFMAADYVRILQERSGEIVGSPEEVSLRNNLISVETYESNARNMPISNYKDSLLSIELLSQEEFK